MPAFAVGSPHEVTTVDHALFRRYLDAHEKGDVRALDALLADDFKLEGVAPQPIDKQGYLGIVRTLSTAFPDMRYSEGAPLLEGDVARVTFRVTGTHKGTLAVPHGPAIPPTGKRVLLPAERQEIRAKGGKIVRHWSESVPGGGLPGILAQLGVPSR